MQFLQGVQNLRISVPRSRLGKMFVGDFEKIIAIQFAQGRGDLIEDKIDKVAPPILVVIFARTIDRGPDRHLFPGSEEGAIERRGIKLQADFISNQGIMITDSLGQIKKRADCVEEDRFDHEEETSNAQSAFARLRREMR